MSTARHILARYGFAERGSDHVLELLAGAGLLGDVPTLPSVPSASDVQGYVQGQANAAATDLQTYVQGQASSALAQGQQQLNNLQGQAADIWNQAQAKVSQAGFVAQGAQSAEQLLQNGYNPDNQADNQALVQAIAAGLALIVPMGTILAGALEALDAAAYAVEAVLVNIGLIPKPFCTTSGGWTADQALIGGDGQHYTIPAAAVSGSFASLALAALQKNWIDKMNCKPAFNAPTLLAGLVQLWNHGVSGPPQQIWVPYTNDTGFWPLFSPCLGGCNIGAPTGGSPFAAPTDSQLAQYAFQPFDQAAAAGMAPYGFVVTVNQGTFNAAAVGPSPAPAPSSSGSSAATAGAVVLGIAAVGTAAWLALGRPLTIEALKAAWKAMLR